MESPIVGIMLFMFFIFAAVNLVFIATDKIETMKVSIDSNVLRDLDAKSSMEILSINCSYPGLDQADILVKNSGKNKLLLSRLDLYFDDRFPRSADNRSMTILEEYTDPLHWNPEEQVNISLYKEFNNDTNLTFTVTNEFGIKISINCYAVDYQLDLWADNSLDKCMNITISNAGFSTLTDFPVYIDLPYDSDMLSDYSDIRFYDTPCGNGGNLLDYEIENHTATKAHIWTRMPSLSTSGEIISVYYKNNSAVGSGENPTEVWNEDFKGVWHLSETDIDDGSGDIKDSTSYTNDATTQGSMTTDDQVLGKVDGSFDLDGNNDYLNAGLGADLNILTEVTTEAWVNMSADPGNNLWYDFMGKVRYAMYLGDCGGTNTYICADYWISGVREDAWCDQGQTIQIDPGTWYHIAVTYDGTDIKGYVNGELDLTYNAPGTIDDSSGDNLLIGLYEGGSDYYFGRVDEARVSNVSRSIEWINQTYQMTANQASFISFGDEIDR